MAKNPHNRETDSGGRISTFSKTRSLGKILKWFGIIITLLTLGGSLVGYGIWMGGTNISISSIKDDVKKLGEIDNKTSQGLTKLLAQLNKQLQGFEIILTKHQSSIDALRSEMRIRHEDSEYISRIITHYPNTNRPITRLSSQKRLQIQEEAHKAAQKRASIASDIAIWNANKALPTIHKSDPLEGISF